MAALPLRAGTWVAVVSDADGGRWTVPLIEDDGGLRRAVPGDGVAEALVRLLAPGQEHDDAFRVTAWHHEPAEGERAVTVDQTNESVVVGERAVVKWAVRLPAVGDGYPQPAAARISALAESGFTGMPQPWGLLRWDGDGLDLMLASVVSLLPGALDGWDWAVQDVSAAALGRASLDDALVAPRQLGALVADMHASLVRTLWGANAGMVREWESRAVEELHEALALVDGDEGERLRRRAARIEGAYSAFRVCVGTSRIEVHGDLHVGQVLRYGDPPTYAVTDFDGNPVLTSAERAAPQPAALDVAGMLASLDHVGRVVIRRTEGADADVVRRWISASQTEFLDSYRRGLASVGRSELLDERLLRPLRLQQEVREFLYAVRHLPHWRYVADAALADLLPDHPPTDP